MAQANKHSLSRSGRDFNGCAHLQSEKIPEVHYPKSVPKCSNHEPSKREVLVLPEPLSHGFNILCLRPPKIPKIFHY
jgi:hypothetical protein